MPRVPPFDRRATYKDLEKVPDIKVAEIVDGELHASPRPALRHAKVHSRLGVLIGAPFDLGSNGPGGWVILDEPELHFGRDVLVPDLAGWRRARLPEVPEAPFLTLSPDWVCEVLSPSTATLDRAKKLRIYARVGVGHVWVVDPTAQLLEVLRLEAGRWVIVSTYTGANVARAEPFAEVPLELELLWGGGGEKAGARPPASRARRKAGRTGNRQ